MRRFSCTLALLATLTSCAMHDTPSHEGALRHVVLFKFKEGTTPAQLKAIEERFQGLPAKIPEIIDFEWGTDVSVENKAAGFTHCFLVTFRDTDGRDTYMPHPAHQDFVSLAGPAIDEVLVVDYFAAN